MIRYLVVLLTSLLSLLPFSAWALPYSGIYFFGDSLTDVGNVQTVYSHVPHPPGAPDSIPGTPYDPQGRASNGPLYADVLAGGLGFAATPSASGGNNFAFGGARTRYQTLGLPFQGILNQVDSFIARPGSADAQSLYVVWGGANNLQDLIVGKTVDTLGNAIPDLFDTVGDIQQAIVALYAEGARSFLIPNAPDLGLTPRVREFGGAAVAGAHLLSTSFNQLLAITLRDLESTLNGLDIIAFDTFSALNDIVADPSSYSLANTTERCYTGDDLGFTGGGTVCSQPDDFLFWDGIHPTSYVHGILGRQMLVAVPEPGTLALLFAALFGAILFGRKAVRSSRTCLPRCELCSVPHTP